MSVQTILRTSLSCSSRRQWILRSFIAGLGGPTIDIPAQCCPFHNSVWRREEPLQQGQLQKEGGLRVEKFDNDIAHREASAAYVQHDYNDHFNSHEEPNSTTSSPSDSYVPWYLQVQQPNQRQENVITAREEIPDLPSHPPPLLQPLLERVSVELGMNDLSLLDLRGIDPPPALGANLLMIVGTARSEKHLHVSADKLCRWLRTEYGLKPYADGLLGRNELKLKLRRRAKRSRLLSAVGAKPTADTELDEGIRTGWVCVNLGRIEGGELPKSDEELARESKIVGFNTQTNGSHVVVQLMTEDKRGQIDLERLWLAVLKKSDREKVALESGENVSDPVVTTTPGKSEFGSGHAPQTSPSVPDTVYSGNQFGASSIHQQAQAFHSSYRTAST